MGNRPTHRPHARNSCGMCKPGKRYGLPRRPVNAAVLREREQRRALSRVQAGAVYDIGEDFRIEPVTLTQGVW